MPNIKRRQSYRQSLQALLLEKPEGLTFVEVVQALRERQGHDVARNTVRAILYAGGFLHRDGRWFAAPQSEHGGRKLRAALAETFVSTEEPEQTQTSETQLAIYAVRQYKKLKAIRTRLAELMLSLQKS